MKIVAEVSISSCYSLATTDRYFKFIVRPLFKVILRLLRSLGKPRQRDQVGSSPLFQADPDQSVSFPRIVLSQARYLSRRRRTRPRGLVGRNRRRVEPNWKNWTLELEMGASSSVVTISNHRILSFRSRSFSHSRVECERVKRMRCSPLSRQDMQVWVHGAIAQVACCDND